MDQNQVQLEHKTEQMTATVKTSKEFSIDKNQLTVDLECQDWSRFSGHKIIETVGNSSWSFLINTTTAADNVANSPSLFFQVSCNQNLFSDLWECTGDIEVKMRKPEERVLHKGRHYFSRYETSRTLEYSAAEKPEDILDLQIRITVVHSVGIHLNRVHTFTEPQEHLTDVALVVEGKKCYVSKQMLASQSKVFNAIFYWKPDDRDKKEILLPDVDHAEFVDLLNMIYPSHFDIDESNYSHILALADRFEFMAIIAKVENFLIDNASLTSLDKLEIANTYNLAFLQESVVRSYTDIDEIGKLMALPEFEAFKDSTETLFQTRIAELSR